MNVTPNTIQLRLVHFDDDIDNLFKRVYAMFGSKKKREKDEQIENEVKNTWFYLFGQGKWK